MRNPDLNHLRDAVRNEIAHAFELVGFAKPRDIARLVCAAHPENIYAIGGRLAEDALTDVARRELKNTTQGRESVSQMASGQEVRPIFNFWKSTLAARLTGEEFARGAGFNSVACMIIPFKDSPVSDWVLGLHVRSHDMFELVNASATAHPVNAVGGLGPLREIMSPSLEFDSATITIVPEGRLTLGYRVLNPQGSLHSEAAEIYFEATGGYLPLARIVTRGQGTLSVNAQGLTPGQCFKVKAGFKYYPGKAECLITVA